MGKLAQIKTKETEESVATFINKIGDEEKRNDSFAVVQLMEKATKHPAKMWGSAIIGFGNTRYISPKTGREVDWLVVGFSPRKAALTFYGLHVQKQADALNKLGKHKVGGGCLYINKLSDVDVKVLTTLIKEAAKTTSP